MELIHGEGICQSFLENWDLTISKILKVAFRSDSKNVKAY